MPPAQRPQSPTSPSPGPGLRLGALLAVGLLLAGCGLRLETPHPDPLEPDAVETVRQRTTADAVALGALARRTDPEGEAAAETALEQVVEDSQAHVEALGGVYDPGPGYAPTALPPGGVDQDGAVDQDGTGAQNGTEGGGDTEDAEDVEDVPEALPGTLEDLTALLSQTAATARADVLEVEDGDLARLLASIATSRLLLAEALAGAAPAADGPPPGAEELEPFAVPEELPSGLTAADVTVLVRSEDAAGYAWEVLAARSSEAARSTAARRAALHRERAEAWAQAGALSGTGIDPRRNVYALPETLTATEDLTAARAALGQVEEGLSRTYATLVATVGLEDRPAMLAGLTDAARASTAAGTTAPTFPGLDGSEA
ncbi:DUF4439 domain-containing protein [Actinotalea sp. BY-33]|uniref:DUF4439 domain-containing protein n=1 Tax=Actinotalea soli TaxID=2819234 RepID=A0A939LSZ0_9CELL|nr:DUF4439 domain-containing protein [Actinotalea soli]MBO1751534.1 DUF4439 domain-containing protein [Actinotalea soli]